MLPTEGQTEGCEQGGPEPPDQLATHTLETASTGKVPYCN